MVMGLAMLMVIVMVMVMVMGMVMVMVMTNTGHGLVLMRQPGHVLAHAEHALYYQLQCKSTAKIFSFLVTGASYRSGMLFQ